MVERPLLSPDNRQADLSPRPHRAEESSPRSSRATTRGATGKGRSKTIPLPKKASSALDKDAKRHHKALEKLFFKAQQQAQPDKGPTVSPAGAVLPCSVLPELSP